MKTLAKRLTVVGASAVVAVAGAFVVAPWEGSKNKAYRDMVGVATICHGYTIGVKMGDYKTDEECEDILAKELEYFNTKIMQSVKVPIPIHQEVAYTSLAWNIGIGAWNSSTLLKKLNNREYEAACQQILRWNKAGGKVVQGLVNRREAEYKICIGKDAQVNQALHGLVMTGEEPLEVGENALQTIETEESSPTPQLPVQNDSVVLKPIERPLESVNAEDVGVKVTEPKVCTKKFLFWCIKYSS